MMAQLSTLLTTGAALGAVLALIWLIARLMQASGLIARATGQGRLAAESNLTLDSKRRLIIVRCDEKFLLILTGPVRDTVVGWLPAKNGPTS